MTISALSSLEVYNTHILNKFSYSSPFFQQETLRLIKKVECYPFLA